MATNEKEINNYLFDQLEIIEEALMYLEKEDAPVTTEYLKRKAEYIKRKLYQDPALPHG